MRDHLVASHENRPVNFNLDLPRIVTHAIAKAARKAEISERLYVLAALTGKLTADGFLLKWEIK
jgi:hypothetical protein